MERGAMIAVWIVVGLAAWFVLGFVVAVAWGIFVRWKMNQFRREFEK